ncbi:MAG: peptide-methionine (R)-S-oxide reductase MsrB [Planctomycetota bacterium]|jgi:peptide-methionine (R)-S-oxide reductase
MQRRLFIAAAFSAAAVLTANRGVFAASDGAAVKGDFPPIDKTGKDWRELLNADQYSVLFEEATERPWSSPLNDEKREGTYVCAACYLPLFLSQTKFDSGTGWPSFYQPIEGNTGSKRDWKLIFPRTEYHCARCGGHQGHVFDDGPEPTGQRWCNNGVALRFVPATEALPELRT